jgi:putative glycosyltransferase (TIGR04372 family)
MSILHRLFYWLGKITNTIIIIPHPIAVGNCGEDIYYGLLKARRERKKLVVLYPYDLTGRMRIGIPNRELIHFSSEYRAFPPSNPLYVLCCWFITLYFGLFRGMSIIATRYFGVRFSEPWVIPMVGQELLWKPKPVMQEFSWETVNACDWKSQTAQWLDISLPPDRQTLAERLRREMGLPQDAWFVCVHVREGGYYNDHPVVERNGTIENYIPAMREITRRGGWVIRMGDATMTPLPAMEHVIDYPFMPQKSELMDVYLIRECRIYIGMQSGILDVAIMFQRPIIQTNMYSWLLGYPQKKDDLGILKRVYSKSEQRFLTPMEWPTTEWENHSFAPRENYEFHENTPEELLDVIKEYFDRGADWQPSREQLAFNELRMRKALEKLESPLSVENPTDDIQARYRLAARLVTAEGMLAAGFLRKNAQIVQSGNDARIHNVSEGQT